MFFANYKFALDRNGEELKYVELCKQAVTRRDN